MRQNSHSFLWKLGIFGDKSWLADSLSAITKIDARILKGERSVRTANIANRMAWVANRHSRPEDRAYSLMGLFGVSMPMLYGEGESAFLRLQEEIMKISDDQSIFAWVDPEIDADRQHGLLADSPKAFALASEYRTYGSFEEQAPFDMTNRGLSISLHLTPHGKGVYLAALQCPEPHTLDGYLVIFVERLSTGDTQYARIRCNDLSTLPIRGTLQRIFVRQSILQPDEWSTVRPTHSIHLKTLVAKGGASFSVIDVASAPFNRDELRSYSSYYGLTNGPSSLDAHPSTFRMVEKIHHLTVEILCELALGGERVAILLGSMENFEAGFTVVDCHSLIPLENLEL